MAWHCPYIITSLRNKPSHETRPSGFFPSLSENLASPLPGDIFYFTRPVCGFLGATFTYPAYIICVGLKKAKQRHDTERGSLVENVPTSLRFLWKPGENIGATGSVTEGCIIQTQRSPL